MKRWIVMLSVAVAQCPDIAAATSKPVRGHHHRTPAVAPPAFNFEPAFEEPAAPASRKASRLKYAGSSIDCGGGKRIISAYYWEGRHTASGQPFNPRGMTAAHRTLPFGTQLTVSNPRTGKSVTVVINDRGPYTSGVSLDLSLGAAQAIGMRGTGAVCLL
jgi:rare lipoprotein A